MSAERQFREAAALAPRDPEALTALAVGLFDKDSPSEAFSQLGPLAGRFPKAATVRFHLGLLLVWMGRVDGAKRQFRLAVAAEPGSVQAKQAAAFLAAPARIDSAAVPEGRRAELAELISIPSVSADPAHAADVRRAAEWVRDFVVVDRR